MAYGGILPGDQFSSRIKLLSRAGKGIFWSTVGRSGKGLKTGSEGLRGTNGGRGIFGISYTGQGLFIGVPIFCS